MDIWNYNIFRHIFLWIIIGLLSTACSDSSGSGSSVSTIPNSPTNVSAVAISSTSIRISWSSVAGATSYEVHCETGTAPISRISSVSATTYEHTGLQPNTAYTYYIRAANSIGTSDFSSPARVTTPLNDAGGQRPAIPTGVTTSVASPTSIRITWNPMPGATSYDVYCRIGSTINARNFIDNVITPPYNHTGLQPDTIYYYYIKSKNSAGESDFSSVASSRTSVNADAIIPQIPTGITASTISSSSIRITWNPVSGATSYDVYYAIGSSSATKLFAFSELSSPFIHTGLEMNTQYFYFIKAKNNAGESGFSSAVSSRTSVSVPQTPTGVVANTQSSDSIRITWSPVSGATSYDVYYEVGTSTNRHLAGNVSSPSITHWGLEMNTIYRYYIKAKNSAGESGFSSVASAKTDERVPSAPGRPTLSVQSSSSILVSWNIVSGATSYDVYYRLDSDSSSTRIFAGTVPNTQFLHTNLKSATRYVYYIKAKNNTGESSFSIASSAETHTDGSNTVVLSAPTGVTATAQQGLSIRIEWNPLSGATSYDVYYETSSSTRTLLVNRSPDTTWFVHTRLTSGTLYRYYIKAKNSTGESAFSNPASATASR